MTKASARYAVLDTASRDKESGDYRAVIETPKGSRNKYRYDSGCNDARSASVDMSIVALDPSQ